MTNSSAAQQVPGTVTVCHFIKGQTVHGAECEHGPARARFATPKLDLDQLVWTRDQPGPAFDTPVAEIIEVLEQTGQWLKSDPHGLVAEALENSLRTGPLPRHIMEFSYENISAPVSYTHLTLPTNREV